MRANITLALAAATALSFVTSMAAAPPAFATRPSIALQNSVFTLADFNGDGYSDVIAAVLTPGTNVNDYEINIQLSDGKGKFTQGPIVDLGSNFVATAIATGDFNGDGLMDVAVLSSSQQALYVALQTATGFEISPIQIAESTNGVLNMAVADINGDRRPDIVIPCFAGAVILLNSGGGHFEAPVIAVANPADFVAVADLNGDKHPDLLLSTGQCCYAGAVTVLLGDGRGGFNGPPSQPEVANMVSPRIVAADFNHDGKSDLAVISYSLIEVLFGKGDGSFQAPASVYLPGNVNITGLAAGDISGDGIPDLVAIGGSSTGTDVFTLVNAGKGTFDSPTAYSVDGAGNFVAVGDINGDGLVDIGIGAYAAADAISFLVSSPKGTFPDGQLFTTSAVPQYLVEGDFNGDHKPDIAELNSTTGLTIYLNSGKTTQLFSPLEAIPFYSGPLVAGDFNNDGRLDLVVLNSLSGETLLGNGDGTFFYQPPSFNIGNDAYAVVAADMNGDGKLDLVTDNPDVLLGNGDGTFRSPNNNNNFCYTPAGVAVADFNRDGKPDVLSLCSGYLILYLGHGDGTLGSGTYVNSVYSQSFTVADVNRDGIPDIVFTPNIYYYSPASTEVSVLIGRGDGTFQAGASVPVPTNGTGEVITGEFNGDGIVDLAVLDTSDSVFTIIPGKGDGTFRTPQSYGTASYPTCMVAAAFHSPSNPAMDDLAFCSTPGIALDLNTTQ